MLRRLLTVLLATAMLAGCSLAIDPGGTPCTTSDDCDPGQSCQQGACSDGCQDPCDHAGVSECRGDVIYECQQTGDCLRFEVVQDCSSEGQDCRQYPGYAQCGEPPCANACSQAQQGETSCYDVQFRTECQYTDNDCWEWVSIEDCYQTSPYAICQEEAGVSTCVVPCQDECSPEDASRCDGTVIQHCTEGDSGCLEWIDGTDCAQDSAVCVDDGQPAACCQPDCGDRMCGPDPGACGTLCGDGCAQGETCAGGNCLAVGWVLQPGDVFTMGSDDGPTSERPAHDVTVPSFEISHTEVTVSQYTACVDDGVCSEPTNVDPLCNYNSERLDHPINCVTWQMAATYCQWLGARLPSEAEWEFAARNGGEDIAYPWGSSPEPGCDHAVMWVDSAGCGTGGSMPVGSMPDGATPGSGLVDMAGNVEEWVQDWHHEDYIGAPTDGSAWEDGGSLRVVRGGGYLSQAQGLRTRSRGGYSPSTHSSPVGFRCARDSQ